MTNDPDLPDPAAGMLEPHLCDECGELYDEAGGDGYNGRCPSCADASEPDDDEEDQAEAWTCFLPACDYRTPGMTLADRDAYDAHMRGHERQLIAARERADRAIQLAAARITAGHGASQGDPAL